MATLCAPCAPCAPCEIRVCKYGVLCLRKNQDHINMFHSTASNSSPSQHGNMYGERMPRTGTGNNDLEMWDHRGRVAERGTPCNKNNGSACPIADCPFTHEHQRCKWGDMCRWVTKPRTKNYCPGKHPQDFLR